MIDLLVDQRVFMHLLQDKMPRLYDHLHSVGLDVAIVLFQWFLCIFTSQMDKGIIEVVWDFLFLEGSIAIFKSAFVVLTLMEDIIMGCDDFSEVYVTLNFKPQQLITDQVEFVKTYSQVDLHDISHLRELYYHDIYEDQKQTWIKNIKMQ